MIRIDKGPAPQQLAQSAAPEVAAMKADYDADPDSYRTGRAKFPKRDAIYGSPMVRTALAASHNGKCCYCETFLKEPYAHRHVEHFRPVAFSQQEKGGSRTRPGYYWLTYDWDNLLMSCTFCNSSKKRNIFPLLDPAVRATSHEADMTLETPLLLKPDEDQPEDHIDFRRDVPFGLTERGRKTIEVVGLDDLAHDARTTYWDFLKKTREMMQLAMLGEQTAAQLSLVEYFRSRLVASEDPASPYSAMAKRFLKEYPV